MNQISKTITPALAFYAPGSAKPNTYAAPDMYITPGQRWAEQRFVAEGFKKPVERIEAVIQCGNLDARIVFKERLTAENKRRFWEGKLEIGAPAKLGVSCFVKVTQYDPGKFPHTNYGIRITAKIYNQVQALNPATSQALRSLFG